MSVCSPIKKRYKKIFLSGFDRLCKEAANFRHLRLSKNYILKYSLQSLKSYLKKKVFLAYFSNYKAEHITCLTTTYCYGPRSSISTVYAFLTETVLNSFPF